jgi:hypothetical protein
MIRVLAEPVKRLSRHLDAEFDGGIGVHIVCYGHRRTYPITVPGKRTEGVRDSIYREEFYGRSEKLVGNEARRGNWLRDE